MKYYYRFFTVLAIITMSFAVNAQEQLGLRMDNYAGINSVALNPAGAGLMPYAWDVNVASGGFFFDNNYAFIRHASLIDFIKRRDNLDVKYVNGNHYPSDLDKNTFIMDFYGGKTKRYVASAGNFQGPSFAIKIGERHTLGVVTNFRFMGSMQNIPLQLSYYPWDKKPFFQDIDAKRANGGFMAWAEYGLNYSIKIDNYTGAAYLGVTAKYLNGYEAGFFENNKNTIVQKMPNDSIMAVKGANFEYGYTFSGVSPSYRPEKKGDGFSFDIGAIFLFGDDEKDYKFKAGVSLIDIGYANFTTKAAHHKFKTRDDIVLDADEFTGYPDKTDLDGISALLSERILGDPNSSLAGNSFKMWTPASLSLQFDMPFTKGFFLGGGLIQRLPLGKHRVDRGNVVMMNPRFEHRWFTISTPFSLYNYKTFKVGSSIRIGYLILGTDDFGSIFFKRPYYSGIDFYAGLKINPSRVFGEKRKRKGKGMGCYSF